MTIKCFERIIVIIRAVDFLITRIVACSEADNFSRDHVQNLYVLCTGFLQRKVDVENDLIFQQGLKLFYYLFQHFYLLLDVAISEEFALNLCNRVHDSGVIPVELLSDVLERGIKKLSA